MLDRPDHACLPRDSVDRLVASWERVQPGLDVSPVGVVARLGRVRAHIDAELDAVFRAHGLTAPDFAVLVTLARLDHPEGVSQRRLMDELGLTSGTVSVRMDRLAEQSLVERRPDEGDRRNTLVALTDRGRALFDRVAPAHLGNERRLLAALDAEERSTLETLLRKLLVEYEGALPPSDAPFHLGLVLAPAHVTIAMRTAVGLEPAPGLLVKRVDDRGPTAGRLRPGDVLLRAGGHDLTSIASLYAAIADGASAGRLDVTVLRGAERTRVRLPLEGAPSQESLARTQTAGRARVDEHLV